MEAGLKGDGNNDEGVSQHSCYIHEKEDHKQKELQLSEASKCQEDEFFHIGVVYLAHDWDKLLSHIPAEKIL